MTPPTTQLYTAVLPPARKTNSEVTAMSQVTTNREMYAPATVRGYAAFFFPPIFVGTPLDLDARHTRANGQHGLTKAFHTEYKGRNVIVSQEGLVAISEGSRTTALGLLNEIMATLLLRGIPNYAVREMELGEASIDPTRMEVCSVKWQRPTQRGMLLAPDFEGWHPKFHAPENIKAHIRRAEVLNRDNAARMDLLLLLEAFSLHQELAHTQSFLFSSIGVERWLRSVWQDYLQERGVTPDRHDPLSHPAGTVDTILEMLNLSGKIDAATYAQVTKLRRKQTGIILQAADTATDSESEASFHFLLSKLRTTQLAREHIE